MIEDYIPANGQKKKENDVDWYKLYASKQFDFRNNKALLAKVRNALLNRQISPMVNPLENDNFNDLLVSRLANAPLSKKDESLQKQQFLLRQQAWCVMLGIEINSEEYCNNESMYFDVLKNFKEETKEEKQTLRQIKVDVYRTFNTFKLKFLNSKVESGDNKLYNLLKVYALILDPTVGYTQGMNFIAAIILMHVPNEALACQIFTKLL